jgi:hypothetical protein
LTQHVPVISVDTNYDPCRIMHTSSGAVCSRGRADGRDADHLISDLYT